MAGIDTSIYGQIKPIQIDNPLNQLARVAQIQGAQSQNQLSGMKIAEHGRTIAGENKLASMLSQGLKPEEIEAGLARDGFGSQALAYRKSNFEKQKADAELRGVSLSNEEKEFGLNQKKAMQKVQKNAALLTNPNFSYDMFAAHVKQSVDSGEVSPEAAQAFMQKAPQDPMQLKAFLTQELLSSLSPKEQLEAITPKSELKDTGGQIIAIQNNPHLPGYGKPIAGNEIAKTQSPDSIASVAQSRENSIRKATTDREANDIQRSLVNQERQLKIDKLEEEKVGRSQQKEAAVASIGNQIAVIDKALKHPGRETATGRSSTLDPRNYIPGTDATDFQVVLDQIGGAAFLQAFESLKGAGQITEVEGKRATDAIARLSRAQSDAEFTVSLNELRDVMTTGFKRLSGKDYQAPAGSLEKPGGLSPAEQQELAQLRQRFGKK